VAGIGVWVGSEYTVPEEGNSVLHPLAINYFIYGKNSLKLTRDFEDNSVENEISEPLLKKYKK